MTPPPHISSYTLYKVIIKMHVAYTNHKMISYFA